MADDSIPGGIRTGESQRSHQDGANRTKCISVIDRLQQCSQSEYHSTSSRRPACLTVPQNIERKDGPLGNSMQQSFVSLSGRSSLQRNAVDGLRLLDRYSTPLPERPLRRITSISIIPSGIKYVMIVPNAIPVKRRAYTPLRSAQASIQ